LTGVHERVVSIREGCFSKKKEETEGRDKEKPKLKVVPESQKEHGFKGRQDQKGTAFANTQQRNPWSKDEKKNASFMTRTVPAGSDWGVSPLKGVKKRKKGFQTAGD